MAIPLPVASHHPTTRPSSMTANSPRSTDHFGLSSPFSSSGSPQYGHSCALTILKANSDHPITAHEPIHKKHDASRAPRFASSFSNLHSASLPTSGFDSSVNIHAVSDHGILLPFLDRPSEVKELLFETRANETLMRRLCSVFGGDTTSPLQRGKDERWDEMLELLVELDRPLLDDEDWLARLESLVMERSPELWAQLARCLGADGLPIRAAQIGSSRFDSWALPARFDAGNDSPLPTPSAVSSDDEDALGDQSMFVNVQPLAELPVEYSRPAGRLHQSTLHTGSPQLPDAGMGQASPGGGVFAMSTSGEDSGATSALEDIMEESHPSSVRTRQRSHSGKFAGLRISALTSNSPASSRRASDASSGRKDGSPLPTGVMSPPSLAPQSPGSGAPDADPSTCFSKHRRLSTMMVHNQPAHQHQSHAHTRHELDRELSPKTRRRGVSETHHPTHAAPARRRAQSFARSFAELTSPTQHVDQLRADHTRAEAERLAEDARRISLQDSTASAPAGLGLHADPLLARASASLTGDSGARCSRPRNHVRSVDRMSSSSSARSNSPPIPGLLPDGRTRHPSGSCGSRDLGESIAAFRATMGLSVSPSPSEGGSSSGKREAGAESRKRKGALTEAAPTSRTADTVEAKISRKGSPEVFQKPEHMANVEHRTQTSAGSGLALGGGFSLAKSGANFRRQSQDTAGKIYSLRSPPAVQRRPGGFVSLAQEYDRARRGRRESEVGFSVNSNAVASSPASSLASFDVGERRDGEPGLNLDRRDDEAEEMAKGEPTPKAGVSAGGATPRASFGARSARGGQGYPFPNLLSRTTTHDDTDTHAGSRSWGPATPLSPLHACNRARLSPPTTTSPRSPSIVFPISPHPSISRAHALSQTLTTPKCLDAFERITLVCGAETSASIRELLISTERAEMHDEELLEEVARRLGLVDHAKAGKVGGVEAREADEKLAEEGYGERWDGFRRLCEALGVGRVEMGEARKRCGPAIDLSR